MKILFQKEITNLLAVLFLSQYVSTIVPPSSLGIAKLSKQLNNSIVKIFTIMIIKGIYLSTVSILCMLSLIGNVFVLDLYYKCSRIDGEMPLWVFKIYFILLLIFI